MSHHKCCFVGPFHSYTKTNLDGWSIHNPHHQKGLKIYFHMQKRCVVWTSEQGVMDVLVEAAHAIKGMREN